MDKLSIKVDALIRGFSHAKDVGIGNMHCINDFPSYGQEIGNEQVDFVGNYNQKPQQQQNFQLNKVPPRFPPQRNQNAPVPQPSVQSSDQDSILKSMMENFLTAQQKQGKMIQQLTSRIDQLAIHNRMLENQIAQQASSSSKAQGKLPSQPENPREHCKAVILRSGKILGDEKKDEVEEEKKKEDEDNNESTSNHDEVNEEANKKKGIEKEEEEKYVPPPPYKQSLPYHAISQLPSYAKFLKEILSNKRRLEDYETVALTEECSALLQNKLPLKLKDPESFSIPCHIGDTNIDKALCDLGASVSLMPLSIFEKLKVGELKPTTISLQLID
ncbi:uncharacterized protein LOC131178800 [Hevea brasiliensis]|uniref:uncharacterized protein LOC131178800 n=1 Tax=Hevea brasiliensis TaxID=3981 RepID=UPI0025E20A62|nr:uncharacterized protein LOC131178800 [Hevea brasiliensis]